MGRIAFKVIPTPEGKILAACDRELVGKTLKEGNLKVFINPEFYFEKEGDEKELESLMKDAIAMNFFGNGVVSFLISKGLVNRENVKRIEGVMHVQIYKI